MAMPMAIRNVSYGTNPFLAGVHSLRATIKNNFNTTTQKIKNMVASPVGQVIIGLGLGLCMHTVYSPLTEKIVKVLGFTSTLPDPFNRLNLGCKILISPFVCIIGPIMEEQQFRGDMQEDLKDKFELYYAKQGLSNSTANILARVTSVFYTSIIFGLVHFANAAFFLCNPILFLPQVIAATLMGVIFGLAKEFTGELFMPMGMHIGNNTLAWAHYIKASIH